MKYPSKKDLWLTMVLWASMLFSIGSSVYSLFEGEVAGFEWVIIVLLGIGLPIFIIWLWLTTYYVMTEENLIIKFGPFKKVIPLESVKSVRKTINPLSSPALSMKRLEISYGRYDMVLISPVDRDAFMEMLLKRCPQARVGK